MGACAKFGEVTLFIEGKSFAFACVLVNKLEFIGLVFHDLFCFLNAHGELVEFKAGFDDFSHFVLNFFEIVNGERLFNVEVIVKSVIDGGADGEFCVREKMENSLCHNMGSGVPESFFAVRIVKSEDLYFTVFFDRGTKVAAFAVDFCSACNSCKAGADALGNLIGGDAVFEFMNVATKGYFNHKFTSCFFAGQNKKASPQKIKGRSFEAPRFHPCLRKIFSALKSSALTRRATVCSPKGLHTLRGWYSANFNRRSFRILTPSLGRKNRFGFPINAFKILS